VQGRRAADDPAQLRPAARHRPAAGPDPLPGRPGRCAHGGEDLRKKISLLEEAFTGYFADHHAFLLTQMCNAWTRSPPTSPPSTRGSRPTSPVARRPLPGSMRSRHQPGRCPRDPGRDWYRHEPRPHRRAPGVLGEIRARGQPAGRKKKGRNSTGHGNPYLAAILGNAAAAAAKTDTFPGTVTAGSPAAAALAALGRIPA
jgi:transposase